MNDLLALAVVFALFLVFAPLLPPMLEVYGKYCDWVWNRVGRL